MTNKQHPDLLLLLGSLSYDPGITGWEEVLEDLTIPCNGRDRQHVDPSGDPPAGGG